MGFDSLELGVGMQRWGFNWVLACRGGVRQPCHAEVGFDSHELRCGHAEEGFDSLELGVGMQRGVGLKRLGWRA